MTLGQFLQSLSDNPSIPLFYLIALPLTAGLAWVFGRDQGHRTPWKQLYSVLVYMACIPGIFAVTLNAYLFLFENQPIMSAGLITQILPIVSMVATLFLIRKNICFEDIPGFDKLGGLIMILTAVMILMWILEKTHILIISVVPFHYFLILFVAIIVGARLGWSRMIDRKSVV